MTSQTRERFIYLSDYTDEVMPCRPSLEEWAGWLAKPDPEWHRPEAAEDGATYQAYSLDWLGDVRADHVEGGWVLTPPAPAGTEIFFLRRHEGSEGWDAEYSGGTVEDALELLAEDGAQAWLACCREGPKLHVTFHADGPRCSVEAAH